MPQVRSVPDWARTWRPGMMNGRSRRATQIFGLQEMTETESRAERYADLRPAVLRPAYIRT